MRIFRQRFALEDVIGSHACWLEASERVTNSMLRVSTFLPVDTVNCVQTPKIYSHCIEVVEDYPDGSLMGHVDADVGGSTTGIFQMFHIAGLRYAKMVDSGLCYVVQGNNVQ